MITPPSGKKFSLQSILTWLPILTFISSLAFQLGYYSVLGLEFLTLLSLTEHVVSTILYLPLFVLVLGVIILIMYVTQDREPERFFNKTGPMMKAAPFVIVLGALAVGLMNSRETLGGVLLFYFLGGISATYGDYIIKKLDVPIGIILLTYVLPTFLTLNFIVGSVVASTDLRKVQRAEFSDQYCEEGSGCIEGVVLATLAVGTIIGTKQGIELHRSDNGSTVIKPLSIKSPWEQGVDIVGAFGKAKE